MWYAKMYFSEGKEIFQYDAAGTQGVPSVQKELPFLESLLSFQELDCSMPSRFKGRKSRMLSWLSMVLAQLQFRVLNYILPLELRRKTWLCAIAKV